MRFNLVVRAMSDLGILAAAYLMTRKALLLHCIADFASLYQLFIHPTDAALR